MYVHVWVGRGKIQTPKYLPLEAPASAGTAHIMNRMWHEYIDYTRKKASTHSHTRFQWWFLLRVRVQPKGTWFSLIWVWCWWSHFVSGSCNRKRMDADEARCHTTLTLLCIAPLPRTLQCVERSDGRLSQKDFGELVKKLGMDNLTNKNG